MDTLRREGLSTDPKNFRNNNIVSLVRNDEEYIRLVSELLRRINPKKSETVRVPRDIGFKGKTKIIKIHNLETEEIFYPIQK
jgi:anaerobic glycerol-3-phosphate dehydrogenase